MAYPTVGNYNETESGMRFVYFNLSTTSSNGSVPPYTYAGAGGDNNVFEIYNATLGVNMTGSGVRLGQFAYTQSGNAPAPDGTQINFYPRVLAGDVNGGLTGSVWLPLYGKNSATPTLVSGDWLVITTGSNTSMTNVKEIKFYWTSSSSNYLSSVAMQGVDNLKVLMSQVTNIPLNAGCWSYTTQSQAIRDAVTGSGAFILRWAGPDDFYDGSVSGWYFPPQNQPSLTPAGGDFNIYGGRVTQGSGTHVCYRARIFPEASAS